VIGIPFEVYTGFIFVIAVSVKVNTLDTPGAKIASGFNLGPKTFPLFKVIILEIFFMHTWF